MSDLSVEEYVRQKISPLLRPLIKDMILDRPSNVIDYILSWMKTNGKKIHDDNDRGLILPSHVRASLIDTESSRNESMVNSGIKFNNNDNDHQRDFSPSQLWNRPAPLEVPFEKERNQIRVSDHNLTANSSTYQDFNPNVSKVTQVTTDGDNMLDNVFTHNCYFSMLSRNELDEIRPTLDIRYIEKNKEVISQSTAGYEVYVVAKGSLDCFMVKQGSSDEKFIRSYNQYQSFGELGTMNSTNRVASIRASSECTLISIRPDVFNKYFKHKIMGKRQKFRDAINKLKILSCLDEYQKYILIDSMIHSTYNRDTILCTKVE